MGYISWAFRDSGADHLQASVAFAISAPVLNYSTGTIPKDRNMPE
jgi:hypothetical protein